MSLNIFTELEITQDLKITQDLEILQNIDICGNILMSGDSILELKTIKSNRSTTSVPFGNYVDISGSALLVPRGSTASRMSTDGTLDIGATAKAGMIMYDTSQNQFIGVIDTATPDSSKSELVWTGLGGVISTDQKTRIEATNDGTNNSGLKFFTNNGYNMCINENGNVGIGNAMSSANDSLTNASDLNLFTNTNASFLISNNIGLLTDGLKLTFETGGNAKIYNTYSAGDLIFGSGGYNDRMRILANGNVGIGTTSPKSTLEIKRGSALSGNALPNEDKYALILYSSDDLFAASHTNRSAYMTIGYQGLYKRGTGKMQIFNTTNNEIQFGTNDTERMRIDSTGRLLVGKTTSYPTYGYSATFAPIATSGIGIDSAGISIMRNTNDYMYMRMNTSGGEFDIQTVGNNDTNTGKICIQPYGGNVGIGTTTPSKTLNVYTSTNFDGILLSDPGGDCIKLAKGDSNTDGYIKIYGNGTNGIELQPNANSWFSKNVGIGTTSPACSLDIRAPDNGTAKIMLCGTDQGTGDLFVGQSPNYGGGIMYNGDGSPSTGTTTDAISFYRITEGGDPIEVFFYMYNSNTVNFKGDITSTGNITAYYSDERLKTFKGTISDPIEKIKKLNGYYFVENELAKSLGYNNDKLQVGVSAQEVEKVLPEIVTDAPIDKKYKTIWYEKLTPLLIEGIKAQQTQIQSLQAQIDELKELIQNKL